VRIDTPMASVGAVRWERFGLAGGLRRHPGRIEAEMKKTGWVSAVLAAALILAIPGAAPGVPAGGADALGLDGVGPAESPRMQRAKDLISEDRWVAAIAELQAAVADAKEPSRDEALFWLAHSQNQAGDLAEAVESIRQLQREFGRSRWTAPAYSLLIELAQKLGRLDVLWRMVPPTPPSTPPPPAGRTTRALRSPHRSVPPPPRPAPAAAPSEPTASTRPAPPPPPVPWVADTYLPDADRRIEALGRLIRTDATKVMPLLRNIALETGNPGAARRAVFVLAQSRHPDAPSMVVDVAKRAAGPVKLAAIRELGRFGGEYVSRELLQVYSTADMPVKHQVVLSLGQRADTDALLKIAKSEKDAHLRDAAIVTLGRAGGREQLRVLYADSSRAARQAVIRGLFNARDEDGLIRIAEQEKDARLHSYVLERLRLMGTPGARAYLEKSK
jgi:hypothetical protein